MENRGFVAQEMIPSKVAILLEELGPSLAKQGSIIATWRSYEGRRTGPYFRFMYRQDRRLRSVYLGNNHDLVATIQAELDRLKEPRRRQLKFERLRRQIKRSLASQKKRLRERLREHGRDLKGFEIRRLHLEHARGVGAQPAIPKEGKNDDHGQF
jgi:hypothetical protein